MPFDGAVIDDVDLRKTLTEAGVIAKVTLPQPVAKPRLVSLSWDEMVTRRLHSGC